MPRNTAGSKIGNGVISLLWQLRCHCYPDHNQFSSLSNTTVVSIFPNPCLWRRSLRSNLGGIDLEKLYRATLRPPSSGCHTLLSERLELVWEAQTYWERSDDRKYVCASQASLEQAMMAFMGRPSPSEGDSDKEINCKNRGRRFCWLSTLGL